jgi:hypothetical protein
VNSPRVFTDANNTINSSMMTSLEPPDLNQIQSTGGIHQLSINKIDKLIFNNYE